jgi:glycosyltransferase involved in cell wall biosynthesis
VLRKEPLVSIVTPVFNRAGILQKTINSVISQTYQNWELFVVDDGSTDNIGEVMENSSQGDSRIHFIKRDREPKSASTCRNIGAENARGDYLIFLDSDDRLETFCLEQRVQVMATDPDLDFAVFPLMVLNSKGEYLRRNFANGKDALINFLSKKSYWAILCPIWKKQFFLKIGGFNEKYPRYQDIEIHIKALTHSGVKYRLCSDYPPDTQVIPCAKNDTVDFALRLYSSLQLLIPQTFSCLSDVRKPELMHYMRGYLKEWLRYLALTNFNAGLSEKIDEILTLFYNYKVISNFKMAVYKSEIKTFTFFVKLLKYFYVKLVH